MLEASCSSIVPNSTPRIGDICSFTQLALWSIGKHRPRPVRPRLKLPLYGTHDFFDGRGAVGSRGYGLQKLIVE